MTESTPKPIFIVGCPRSGTTLLASRLNLHSQIAVTPESHFFEMLDRKFFKILYYPLTNEKLKKFLDRKRLTDFRIDFNTFIAAFNQTEQKLFNVFDTCMNLYRIRENKKYWCEKTPQNFKYLKQIFEYYANARVICIVRDGRDVAFSLSKAPWRERNMAIPALEWNEYAMYLFEALSIYSKANFLVLKFEEILQFPEKSFRSICEFLEVKFEMSLLSIPSYIPSLVPKWEMEWKGNVMHPFDANAIGRWHFIDDTFKKKMLNSIMEPNLKRLNYERFDLKVTIDDKKKIFFNVLIARILKPILDFVSHYSRFRNKVYHPF
jgi:hypothetical protein